MNPVAALLAPWMLLLPAAGAIEQMAPHSGAAQPSDADQRGGLTRPTPMSGFENAERMAWEMLVGSFSDDSQKQVRIEQHVTIRITPRGPSSNPNFLFDLPNREVGPRFEERRTGRCLPVAGIAGVQISGDNRLILFMRDHRIISAGLERACSARDFYSGFLVQRTDDGMLCMGRDKLQSRAGANCAVSRLRQLVEVDD
jgi:hypothetical protein